MLEEDRKAQFRDLVKLCLALDVIAAIAGGALAVAGGYLMAQWNGWDQQTAWLAAGYGLVVLFNFSGASIGILRLYDRYALYTAPQLIGSAVRLGGVVAAWAMEQGLLAFLLVWVGGTLLQYLLMAALALRELLRHDARALSGRARLGLRDSPGALGFVISTKLQSAVRLGSRELDTLLVGSMLGVGAAGLYKVVKQFSAVLGQVTEPFHQVLYPELARLWGRGDLSAFMRLVRRSVLIAGAAGVAVWVGFIVLGHWLLVATVGPQFVSAYSLLVWYMSGTVIAIATFALLPATLAMGVPAAALGVLVSTTVLYLGSLIVYLPRVGLTAAGMAYLGFYAAWAVGMISIVMRRARHSAVRRPIDAGVQDFKR
jgi:O-antigen/teichoic acid export membrane protein